MTKRERIDALFEEKKRRILGHKIENPLKVCSNCVRWVRHYVKNDVSITGGFVPIKCGHCTYPRLKSREEHDTCEHFCTFKDLPDGDFLRAFMDEAM